MRCMYQAKELLLDSGLLGGGCMAEKIPAGKEVEVQKGWWSGTLNINFSSTISLSLTLLYENSVSKFWNEGAWPIPKTFVPF